VTDVLLAQPGDGERLRAPAGTNVIRLSGDQAGGVLAIVEHLLPPGATGAMPHIHHGHAEHFHVLDGLITFEHAGGAEAVGAGGTVSIPIGAVHGFRNASAAAARCLVVLSPAGYENYFRDLHRALLAGEDLDPGRLAELRAAYNTVTV
jgi:quercetin dioxygenase-like cupin family protein